MKHLFFVFATLLFSTLAFGQGFPDAIKQPKQVEMKSQHRKFQKQSRRRHHSMHHDSLIVTKRRVRR